MRQNFGGVSSSKRLNYVSLKYLFPRENFSFPGPFGACPEGLAVIYFFPEKTEVFPAPKSGLVQEALR
jgi:hypothetical protein